MALLLVVSACTPGAAEKPAATLVAAAPTLAATASALPTDGAPLTTALPTVTAPEGFAVLITSPSQGERFPTGSPLTVHFSAGGGPFAEISLLADGALVDQAADLGSQLQYYGTLNWSSPTPGSHTLVVQALNPNKETASADVAVEVGGEAETVPTAAPTASVAIAPPPDVTQGIIALYQRYYGLTVPAPVIARFESLDPADARWVSAAYVGNYLYEVGMFDDGRTDSIYFEVNRPSAGGMVMCRPAGSYRMLVVFVDYGNTDITQAGALNALQTGAEAANMRYADYAAQHGLTAPILSLDVTGTYLAAPPTPGQLVTAEQVQSLTGFDASQFDLLAQVDLDTNNTYGQGTGAGGYALEGCTGRGTRQVNIWIHMGGAASIDTLAGSLLDHELSHIMGWQHWWPCGQGGPAPADGQPCNPILPTFMFGWTDTDGDGLAEILDPTPYGGANR